ncbi:hypothetical protein [Aeropyrum camini]|uniref:DUF973 family protein n=1 Tax=Aeropyrum camini SY1 = JCM 12091 TaxID=1198449 RepID=U3TD13_9CREN|nr:hypothetical protein [Aeropyrum camini]BAN90316.1 hypothetical protein ACAM_0847 [Aeropyrum camini SY1 = JCM 12091]
MEPEEGGGGDTLLAALGEFSARMLLSIALALASIVLAGASLVSIRFVGVLLSYGSSLLGLPEISGSTIDSVGKYTSNTLIAVGGLAASLIAYRASGILEAAPEAVGSGRAGDVRLAVLLLKTGSAIAAAGSILLLAGVGEAVLTAGFILFQSGLAIIGYRMRGLSRGMETALTLLLGGAAVALIGAVAGAGSALLAGLAMEAAAFYTLMGLHRGPDGVEGETL